MELKREDEVFKLVAFEMEEVCHLQHLTEVELHHLVAIYDHLIFELVHLNARNMLESSILAYKT